VLPIALGIAAILFALVALALHAAGRARARALAEDVRGRVEPYLRRKAAELGVPTVVPVWTARTPPEEVIEYSAALAARLLEAERGDNPSGPTAEFGLAQTQEVPKD
jgi:hypothetical protein